MGTAIVFSIISLISLGMSVYFGVILYKSIACFWWPSVKGRILSNNLKQTARINAVPIYGTRINFSYTVNNTEMIGRKVDFVQWDNAKIVKLFTSALYFEGQEVKVYYNPKKPAEAILQRGPKLKYIWPFLCGLVPPVCCTLAFIYEGVPD